MTDSHHWIERPERKWRFRLTSPLRHFVGLGALDHRYEFWDDDTLLAVLSGGVLELLPPFTSDGCTPNWKIGGLRIGVPTPRSILDAVGYHDLMLQFAHTPGCPWTEYQSNVVFGVLMRTLDGRRWLTDLYYWGVESVFGYAFRALSRRWKNLRKSHDRLDIRVLPEISCGHSLNLTCRLQYQSLGRTF
jgi:hypothetical protein